MISDFDIICHHFDKDIKIYPISDVHLGAAEHMRVEWDCFCERLLKEENSYIMLVGDLINNCTRNSVSNIFEETMRPREQKRVMADMLKPIKNKILCAVPGNHEWRSTKDADDEPTYDIMCKLDLEHLYRENMAFVKINFGGGQEVSGKTRPCYAFAVTHGAGGGILTGASVNRSERFAYSIDGLDCFISGHTHKPFVTQPNKIVFDKHNNKISFQPFKVVTSTAWLGYGGYAARKMLLPSSHAPQTILLHSDYKKIEVTM